MSMNPAALWKTQRCNMGISATFSSLQLAVKSHDWRKPGPPGVLAEPVSSVLCKMHATHSQPITEGSAAVQPRLHGNLNFLLEFPTLLNTCSCGHYVVKINLIVPLRHVLMHRPLYPPPPPHPTISLPPHYTSCLPIANDNLAFSHDHLSGGNDSTYIETSIWTKRR